MDGAELRYSYTGDRLTGVFDASNRLALKVRYGPTGRVTEIGDAEGRTSFTYDSAPGSISRATSITDPLGATRYYEHLGTGLLSLLRDATNGVTRISYNDSNRPVSLTSPSGEETRFTYDAGDRLVRESSRQGETIYAYDLESHTSDANVNGQNRTFNARGQVVSQQSADGRRLTSEYDAAGNEIAFTLSDLGRFEIQRNAQGRVFSKRYPSGLLQQFDYDSRGRLLKQRDNRGRSINYKRDKSGALMSFATAEGNSVTAQRDEAGRITSLSTSSGKTRLFRYDKRGALTEFKDARGNRRVINYDRGGRVKSINEEGGDTIMVHRDAWGSVRGLVRINMENIGKGDTNLSWPEEGKTLDAATSLQPINFKPSPTFSVVTTPPTQNLCAFGFGDGFTDGWGDDFGFERDFGDGFVSSSCMDLFGIFGSRYTCGLDQGFAWFIDPWTEAGCFSFGGETYEQCAARQRQICERNRTACGAAAVSALAIAVGTCLITTHNNPTATVICMVAASAKYLADLTACDMHDQNCRLSIPDKCRR
jgi:YD repeat-containing protein